MAKFVGGQYKNMVNVGVNNALEAINKPKEGIAAEVEFDMEVDGPTVSDKSGEMGIGARLAGGIPTADGDVEIDVSKESRNAFDGNARVRFHVKYTRPGV